jgi:hypothetical protein
MKSEDGRPGMRVVSHSDGFTHDLRGSIVEVLEHHQSHPEAFYVRWDNGMASAVACAFVEPVDDVPNFIEGSCPYCRQHGGSLRVEFDTMSVFHSTPICDAFDRMSADEFIDSIVRGRRKS